MSLPERDDAALVADALAGEDLAFTELVRRYKTQVYRFVRHYVGDADEAYDLVQEAFVSAWSGLSAFDQNRPMSAWLRRIALNKCRDWTRRRQVRRFFFGAQPLDAPLAQAQAVEETADENGEAQLARLDAAIADLPPALKEPLLMTVFEGLSHKEAAALLGISAKAVETRVNRARRTLAGALGRMSDD